ncbi:MAG TPA: hypothetical protein VGM88_22520 [Kofleriaceae bacterium]|jgi:hypothetical protein
MDPTAQGVIGGAPADGITEHAFTYGDGLPFEVFRAGDSPRGAVLFCSGWPDAGLTTFFGKPLRAWQSYRDWARLVARAGLAAVLYGNREPTDVHALIAHLRANAASLAIDASRIGAWACSGHGPVGLAALSSDALACGALLYPYTLDCAAAAAQFRFATPPVGSIACPLLVVRAAADAMPGLNDALDRFLAAHPATRIDVPGPHAFDLVDDTPHHRAAVAEIVAWLAHHLG